MYQNLLEQLQSPCHISRSQCPKIQRVAHHLRNREAFAKYYSPRMLSLGPIHNGEPHLKVGEKYKMMWASMYIQRDQESRVLCLFGKIAEKIEELKNLYDEDAIGQFNDQQLSQMLFIDGCAMLQILEYPDILNAEALKAKVDQMALVRQDALLLENQLPFRVLQLLSDLPDHELIEAMDNFLLCHHLSPGQKPQPKNGAKQGNQSQREIDVDPDSSPNPVHLLDQLRRKVLRDLPPRHDQKPIESGQITHRNLKELKAAGIQGKRSESGKITHRNLKELKESGIKVKRNLSAKNLVDVTFSSCFLRGELKIPELVVDDTSASTYLNLMAYEACPDFENKYEISSYLEFLDSLIDIPDDVKELRKAEVLINRLGGDKELAELFNIIGTDVVPNDAIYAPVRDEIQRHYQKKYKTWYAVAKTTYFSNPWSIIALIAASWILFLTSVQGWFAAFPSHH